MKIILKILIFPVSLVIKVLSVLGNIITNISSYIIGLLLMVIGGCAVYCIVKAMWSSLAILVLMGLAAFIALFGIVYITVRAEMLNEHLGHFLRS